MADDRLADVAVSSREGVVYDDDPTAWLREREATRRARDAQFPLPTYWRELLDWLSDESLAEDSPDEVIGTLVAFAEPDRVAEGDEDYDEDELVYVDDGEMVFRAELVREINAERYRRRDVRLAARRALSARRAPLRVSRRRESHRGRPGHRRVRATESPPDDPPAAPPRLALAPKPRAIFSFGCLTPERRGAA
ncbi:MAG: hypothetical protein H0U07_05115 [Actinobacteria bacterium]|nr:hypothetical protein [Actinomycetota bacterium]